MKTTILAGLIATTLTGCVVAVGGDTRSSRGTESNWERQEQKNREAIAKLSPGASVNSVMRTMGTPDFDEFVVVDDRSYRVLYYRTHRVTADGMTTRDECTPLVFLNGELVGWGESKLRLIQG
ncbi:hypothetical protein CWE11_00080 [Aliidiomarina sanyensis]|uniref:DUF3192 domain-containing protein n=1 Tax=Aliidiomarina sanyensis TaxID=1249555 RepID=A0A432WSC7_9GAMM|nr:hypothetical protein CWE11_00080 [Aliidiomarina sanyensis]